MEKFERENKQHIWEEPWFLVDPLNQVTEDRHEKHLRGGCFSSQRPSDPSAFTTSSATRVTWVTWATWVTWVMRMRAMAVVQCIVSWWAIGMCQDGAEGFEGLKDLELSGDVRHKVLGTTDTMGTMDTMGTRGTMCITSTRHNMWTIMNIADTWKQPGCGAPRSHKITKAVMRSNGHQNHENTT